MAALMEESERKGICLDCLSERITESVKEQVFQYGSGKGAVALKARMPVFTCQECGFEYTDERGDAARSAAVFAYLDGRKKKGAANAG
jgi:hypothetical protein